MIQSLFKVKKEWDQKKLFWKGIINEETLLSFIFFYFVTFQKRLGLVFDRFHDDSKITMRIRELDKPNSARVSPYEFK